MWSKFHVIHLLVRKCEQWQHGWLDPDAIWGGEWGRARYGCVRFWWRSSKGKGSLGWIQCRNGILINDRLLCEKLTIFPYADYIVEFFERLAFLWYSQVQDRSGGWCEIYTIVTVQKHPIWQCSRAAAGCHDAAARIQRIWHCTLCIL